MREPLCVCSRCGLTGYYPTDKERNLCHNCVHREQVLTPRLEELQAIQARFLRDDLQKHWEGCNYAKAFIGNAIAGAIQEVEVRIHGR